MTLEVPRSLLQSAVMLDPWVPDGIAYESSTYVGKTGETGEKAYTHRFRLNYRGEVEHFTVGVGETDPQSQIEDMAAAAAERMMKRIDERLQKRGAKLTPEQLSQKANWNVRHELAGAMRQYMDWAKKRNGSSNSRVLYKGLK